MKLTKTTFYLTLFSAVLLMGCSITTTKPNSPVFQDDKKIQTELTSLVKAENINLVGKETTIDKTSASILEIDITNGDTIPTNPEERSALAISISKTIKSNLKAPDQFDSYRLKFIKKDVSAGITKTNWVEYVFSSKDL